MEEGRILMGSSEGAVVARFEGHLTQASALSITEAVERCARLDVTGLLIDIRSCSYMDSTILGTLARWVINFYREHNVRPLLVGLWEGSLENTFKRMCLDQLFKPLPASALKSPSPELETAHASATPDPRSQARRVLDAHETLATLSPENAEEFRLLLDILRREVAKED